MASEHLRKQWREAQIRHRARVAAGLPPLRIKRAGSKKAHKPTPAHPWVREGIRAFEEGTGHGGRRLGPIEDVGDEWSLADLGPDFVAVVARERDSA